MPRISRTLTTGNRQACRKPAKSLQGLCEVTREVHCTAAQPFESLTFAEGSVQLVSTSLALRLPHKVERDARICNYTVTNRCFSGPERESPQPWFLSVHASLSFKSRFVKHVLHRSKHLHIVPRQTSSAALVVSGILKR